MILEGFLPASCNDSLGNVLETNQHFFITIIERLFWASFLKYFGTSPRANPLKQNVSIDWWKSKISFQIPSWDPPTIHSTHRPKERLNNASINNHLEILNRTSSAQLSWIDGEVDTVNRYRPILGDIFFFNFRPPFTNSLSKCFFLKIFDKVANWVNDRHHPWSTPSNYHSSRIACLSVPTENTRNSASKHPKWMNEWKVRWGRGGGQGEGEIHPRGGNQMVE